jgi:diguanylate cyclase (GGDEF)-like protein
MAAQAIHDGRFDLPPLEVAGPRELADTASAFNEMSSTLAAVEAHTVALADDPDAAVLGEALPGRTGRALQVALNRLRASMQAAEQNRLDLQQAATHDSLTGLLNRAAALEVVRRDLRRVGREGGAVAALFLDLDGLKVINDGHGHAAGDDALRMTADALRSSTRATDVVARLGGDEFLITGVVHDVPAEVEALAERIHESVAGQILRCETEDIALRCSIGVALAGASDTVDTLIHKADSALYDAKRRGRDRIAWYDGAPSPARPSDA